MRVYKGTYRDRSGKLRHSAKWYIEFRDPRCAVRKLCRVIGSTDKSASEELGKKLVKLAAFCNADETPDVPLRRWLETMTPAVRSEVQRLGLLSTETVESHRAIASHVADYERSMKAGDGSGRHVSWTISQVNRVIEGCGFVCWPDVKAEAIKTFLAKLAHGEGGLKARSYNGYVTAFKSFANWAVKAGCLAASPLATLSKRKLTDETERRALSMDEARLLLAITRRAPERFGMTGEERSLVYRLAIETGLRAGELRSLTRSSFELAGPEPIVKAAADSSKNKKAARIHLSEGTAAALSRHVEKKLPRAKAFNLPESTHTAEMFRADVADGRAAWLAAAASDKERMDREGDTFLAERDDADRVLVFHSLRHTRGVWLFEHFNATPREAQELMRVSDISLVNRYAKSFRVGGRNFADRNPDLSPDLSPAVAAALPAKQAKSIAPPQ